MADLCVEKEIPFVLGHALYMKAIHGGKVKNDRIDSYKIAALLRGGNLPQAYVYPRAMRAARDLLRRRLFFVRDRAGLYTHIQNTITQQRVYARLLETAHARRGDDAKRYARRTLRRALERTAAARRATPRPNPERLPRV